MAIISHFIILKIAYKYITALDFFHRLMLAFPAIMWEDSALSELFHADYLEIMTVLMCRLRAHIESVTGYIIMCIHLRFNMQEERNSGLCWGFVAPCSCIWTPAHPQPVTSCIRQKCLMAVHPLTALEARFFSSAVLCSWCLQVTLRAFLLTRYRAVAVPLLLILPMVQGCCFPKWPRKPPKGILELKLTNSFLWSSEPFLVPAESMLCQKKYAD